MRMPTTIGLSLALLAVSTAAIAKQTHSPPHQPVSSLKAKPFKTAAATGGSKRTRTAARGARWQSTALPPPDEYLGPVRVVGHREVGEAAWYGGWHVGLRTASGERLDAVHATAAHRTLPLHSLVRVTNLSNGRSVIVKINDRGPVSRSLLIDVSPRVAEVLRMRQAGIARVSIEPVAPAPNQPAAEPAVAGPAVATQAAVAPAAIMQVAAPQPAVNQAPTSQPATAQLVANRPQQ